VFTVAIVFVLVTVFSPRSKDSEATPLDPVGAALSIVGLAALLYGIIEGPVKGWTSAEVVGAFVVSAVTLIGFVVWERRAEHPMLPMDYFRDPGFSIGSGVITFAFFVMFGFFFLITQYLQFVRDYSPLDAGVATMPLAAALVASSPRSAALSEKVGTTRVITAGFAFIVAGFVLMSFVDPDTPYVFIAVALVLLGIGMGITVAPATGSIMAAVPLNKAGVGSAVNDTTREVGGALGIAVLGSIANSVYRSEINDAPSGVLDGLPPDAADAAGESIGAAVQIAASLPPEVGDVLASDAKTAFTTAFGNSLGAAAVLAGVVGTVVFAAGRRYERRPATASSEKRESGV